MGFPSQLLEKVRGPTDFFLSQSGDDRDFFARIGYDVRRPSAESRSGGADPFSWVLIYKAVQQQELLAGERLARDLTGLSSRHSFRM